MGRFYVFGHYDRGRREQFHSMHIGNTGAARLNSESPRDSLNEFRDQDLGMANFCQYLPKEDSLFNSL